MKNNNTNNNTKIDFVKTFPLENLNILKSYLLLHKDMRPFSTPPQLSRDGSISYDFHSFQPSTPDSCPLGVPQEFRNYRRRPLVSRGPRKPPKDKYPLLYSQAVSGSVSDSTLVETFRSRLAERPLILWQSDEEEISVFYGSVKGSDSYNMHITDRINACSTALVKNYSYYYFLTLTYAYKTYGTDIISAWQLFNKQLSSTLRALRKTYKMGYVCVLEATKKGYPHAHIILGVQEPAENWHVGLGDGHHIKHGQFYKFLASHIASPVFALQKAGGKGLVKYLGKYISKGAEQIVKTKTPGTIKLSASERKALLSCLMPVLAGIRQYRFSIRDNFVPGVSWNKYTKDDIALLKDLVQMGITTPEGDAILIRLLNNLTASCSCSAWVVFNKTFKKSLEPSIGWYSQAPPELLERFHSWGYPMGCPGCIVTSFLHNLSFPDSEKYKMPGELYAEKIYNVSGLDR